MAEGGETCNTALLNQLLLQNQSLIQKVEKLEEKIEQQASRQQQSRSKKRNVKVPSLCRSDFRKWYNTLKKGSNFSGFGLNESIDSPLNQNIVNKVMEAVESDHKGKENCPWSRAQLRSAASTYYKSRQDAKKRAQSGVKERHNELCRRQGRMRDKLQRRLKGLQLQKTWSTRKKEAIEEVLNMNFISSDESDFSEDENNELVLRGYVTKPLSWERKALTKVKKELDSVYYISLPRRTKASMIKRTRGSKFSKRKAPEDPVDWAVRSTDSVISSSSSSDLSSTPSGTQHIPSFDVSPLH